MDIKCEICIRWKQIFISSTMSLDWIICSWGEY